MTLRLRIRLFVVVGIAALACGAPVPRPGAVLDATLLGGRRIESLLVPRGVNVVLVYETAMCYSRSEMYTRWEGIARARSINLVLVVDQPLSPEDARAFRMQRIRVAGALAPDDRPRLIVPSEFIIANGRIVARAEGQSARRALKLWMHPLVQNAALQ